ncbi:MAG: WbqC family protein, partial [Bacillus sp. (in: Bacteria)]|nr:WbqC family protein [Bacillus sp. (in: firmicutes)]
MKAGIMQPYFMPYIGYWQLMNAVDIYVIYDDVNFIKGGWINRNRILNGNNVQYINVPVSGASPFKSINQIEVRQDKIYIEKNKKTIWNAYHKRPYFETVYPLVKDILECEYINLAQYLEYSIKKVCKYLNINTKLLISSQIEKDNSLKGEAKVIDICKQVDADIYYNAIGGRKLYDFSHFEENHIKLFFLQSEEIKYVQGNHDFAPNLSIIDVMMN